jgi:hypothetical protein
MTSKGIDGDFTAVDTAMLNRYFGDYYNRRGQAGTNAQQRNLLPLFNFLQHEYNHGHPYTDALNRYAEVKGKPQTLSAEFVEDLLNVTGGGKHATTKQRATMRLSGFSAARESGGRNFSAWSCMACLAISSGTP